MALDREQLREILRAHRQAGPAQLDITAVIVFDHLRTNVGAIHLGRRIDVRDETHHRPVATFGSRDRTHHIAVFVDFDLLQAKLYHLFEQVVQQQELFGRRGERFAFGIALRVERRIAQQTFQQFFFHILLTFNNCTLPVRPGRPHREKCGREGNDAVPAAHLPLPTLRKLTRPLWPVCCPR